MRHLNQNIKLLKLSRKLLILAHAIASAIAIGLGSCAPTSAPSGSESPKRRLPQPQMRSYRLFSSRNSLKAVAGDRAE